MIGQSINKMIGQSIDWMIDHLLFEWLINPMIKGAISQFIKWLDNQLI